MTSVQKTIYNHMINYLPLTVHLANSTIDDTKPAIYEEWAPSDTPMPYINVRYDYAEGFHWAKRDVTLYLDIFTGKDTILLENIKNECLNCLDRVKIFSDNDVMVRSYSVRDSSVNEPDPNVEHWSMEFVCYYWRKEFIGQLNNEE
jgi:hypothetical protein